MKLRQLAATTDKFYLSFNFDQFHPPHVYIEISAWNMQEGRDHYFKYVATEPAWKYELPNYVEVNEETHRWHIFQRDLPKFLEWVAKLSPDNINELLTESYNCGDWELYVEKEEVSHE